MDEFRAFWLSDVETKTLLLNSCMPARNDIETMERDLIMPSVEKRRVQNVKGEFLARLVHSFHPIALEAIVVDFEEDRAVSFRTVHQLALGANAQHNKEGLRSVSATKCAIVRFIGVVLV